MIQQRMVFQQRRFYASGYGFRSPAIAGAGSAVSLLVICLAVIIGPLFWQQDPIAQHIEQRLAPISVVHPLGTDQFGRDTLARILHGGRWSLLGALVVCLGTTMIGGLLGLIAALGPRWLDLLIGRISEIFQAIPGVLLALALTALLRPSFENLLLALILTNWTWYARMYRALIVQELARPYIEASQALGVDTQQLVVRHILPNILGPALVIATTNVGAVILNLSALSFIGLGLPPPTPEWGNLINESRSYFQRAPLLMIIPGFCIAWVVLSLNLLGNAMRDRVDQFRGC
jgi:ABC-type dipeptide/oligopeptide/nickel transport system permease subunit